MGYSRDLPKRSILWIRTIARSMVLDYIKSFFSGENRDKLSAIEGNHNYYSLLIDGVSAPKGSRGKPLAVSTYYRTHPLQVPAVLLTDTGATYRSDLVGFSPTHPVGFQEGQKVFKSTEIWDMNLTLTAIDGDVESVTLLTTLLTTMLIDLYNYSGWPYSQEEGHIEVFIANQDYSWSQPSEYTIEGSSVDQIYYSTLDLQLRVEGWWYWGNDFVLDQAMWQNKTKDMPPKFSSISDGDTVPAGQWIPVSIDPPISNVRVQVTNGKVRLNSLGTGWEIWLWHGESALLLVPYKAEDHLGEIPVYDRISVQAL